MTDFTLRFGDFNTTEVVVSCNTEAAKEALGGAVSFTIRKSAAFEFEDTCEKKGLTFIVA